MQWTKGEFSVTCDPDKQDLDVIHGFLSRAYWAKGISKETVQKSIDGSLCFALLHGGKQIGFARVITDRATVAYLGDVFVLEEHRGRGLSKWLMECVSSHPELQGLRRWMLATSDAHGLYKQFGFAPLSKPHLFMERHDPDVYVRATGKADAH
jgi:GNAT superfamily N-acetyltransferase